MGGRYGGGQGCHYAQHFLSRTCADLGRDPMRLSKMQVQQLMGSRWPGNIRELRNVIERAVILSTGSRARLDLAMPEDSDTQSDVTTGPLQSDGIDDFDNHPIALMEILVDEGGINQFEVLCGAILHDTVEDTETTEEELREAFGEDIL